MFSTILSAELVSGEQSDEDSAWIETGGDSLTFSESHLMGVELGLRLAVTLWPRPTLGLPATGTCHIRTTGGRLGLFFARGTATGPTRGVLPSLRGSWLDTLGILL